MTNNKIEEKIDWKEQGDKALKLMVFFRKNGDNEKANAALDLAVNITQTRTEICKQKK